MAVKFDTGKYIETFTSTQKQLEETITSSLSKYFDGIISELYKILVKNSISQSEYKKIIDKMQSEIGIYTTDVSKKIKSIYKDVLTESRINNPKYKQSILDYEVANTLNSITNEFTSAYNDVKTALDHTKHVMDMQTERDAKALLNNMKGFTPDKIEKNMQAFKDVFQNDYGQRYMQQLTENPLLNRLISQEDDKLYITLNGKKFDLEKLAENQANHFTTQTMHEISQAQTKEKGTQIFRFVRVSPVKNERDHSIHDNEHNDDYFTTNSELVGTEFDGKILLDAYTAIDDYHYGDQPPYGCQHIFVGVEEDGVIKTENNNEKNDNNEKKEKELTENKNNDKIQETLEEKLKKMVQEPKSKMRETLEKINIEQKEISLLSKKLSEKEIIDRLCGNDKTEGSCASLALSYIANKAGFDVLDFRGGNSLSAFSGRSFRRNMSKFNGVEWHTYKDKNDFNIVTNLFMHVKQGKEYCLSIGRHSAIIKLEKINNKNTFLYLELQDTKDKGWHKLTNKELKTRFKCKKEYKVKGIKLEAPSTGDLYEIESLANNTEFYELMKYINTSSDKQLKGIGGEKK